MNTHHQSLNGLIKHYINIWRNVWKIRHELEPIERNQEELEFLPAHLELTESPLSPTPKWSARLIMLFSLLSIIWAYWGELDIVAVAQGKTQPNGQSKIIQPLETAEVKEIYVHDGAMVQKGDIVMSLSALGSDSDVLQIKAEQQALQLANWRYKALLESLEQKQPPYLPQDLPIHDSDRLSTQTLLNNQYHAWLAQDQQIQARIRQHEAEADVIRSEISKLKALEHIESRRSDDLAKLVKENFIAEHVYLEQKGQLLSNRNDQKSKQKQLTQILAAIDEAKESRRVNTEVLRRDTADSLRQNHEQLIKLETELIKAQQRQNLMQLKAPVSGTVQQLAVHTIGGVVTAAQPLMVIVPEDFQTIVKVQILNKDIGFVHIGQEAIIKVEAFPYTRYGYLTGKVTQINYDAIEDEHLGLVYLATISLDHDTLMIDGNPIRLGAGMNVTAEIKTGKRKVIDFLLSPLQTTIDESMKQR
ncbi:MAG: HlyD family type I secretion periplasmic adaptor subunit [Cardiobacteriaceae bacterium]|nr:HlyD family type I secretion periplasmic adaptor subunit [Cardiobacteriaceae bacterium]